MMSCSCLDIELLEMTEQGRRKSKLKMVILHHIKDKPVESNVPPLIYKLGSVATCTTEDDDDEVVDCSTSGMPSSMADLFPRVSRTGEDPTISRLSATLMSINSTLQVRYLCQRGTTRLWQGMFYTLKWNPVFGLALPPAIGRKD